MSDVNALTYLDLQNAVLGKRFPESSRGDCKRWLATAYQDVWSADDWSFKRVSREDLAVTSADGTPTMPATFASATDLYDDSGCRLAFFAQERFERMYGDVLATSQTGSPEAFTVVNRQIYLAPLPNADATFKLSYKRRLSHRDSGDAVVAGFMSDSTDIPIWDDFHSILIPRATALGLTELNDPTFSPFQDEFERQLVRMKDDYEQTEPARQWGRSSWC